MIFFPPMQVYICMTQHSPDNLVSCCSVWCDVIFFLFLEKKSKLAVSNKEKQNAKLWIEGRGVGVVLSH